MSAKVTKKLTKKCVITTKFSLLDCYDYTDTNNQYPLLDLSNGFPVVSVKKNKQSQLLKDISLSENLSTVLNKKSKNPIETYFIKYFTNKPFRKLFFSHISTLYSMLENIEIFYLMTLLLKNKFNPDVVFNHCSSALLKKDTDPDRKMKYQGCISVKDDSLIKFLSKYYNHERVLKLIFNSYEHNGRNDNRLINDVIESSRGISFEKFKKMIPDKPKSFREIHDYFFDAHAVGLILERPDYNLESREDILKINNSVIQLKDNSQLKVVIPTTRHQLAKFSLYNCFSNCVGSSDMYAERMVNKQSTIIGLFSLPSMKPTYCIEATKYNFKEAKGVHNSEISREIYFELQKIICKIPDHFEEFIPVEDHKFIQGYKYRPDIESLYIMFNKGSIYEYKNVPFETYEEFQNSPKKGHMLNTYIKKFEYEQIRKAS